MRRAGLLATATLLLGCAGAGEEAGSDPLLVFAASDLRLALPEIARAWELEGGAALDLVFGSTGELAAQLEHGAPADLFFAADESFLDHLITTGAVVADTRTVYGVGRLAVITAPGRPLPGSLSGLLDPPYQVITLPNPRHAPYGRAAHEALETLGLGDALRPRIVFAGSVAQVERQVGTGNADAGIVALAVVTGDGARAHLPVDERLHRPLRQAAGMTAVTRDSAVARAFLRYVGGAQGKAILARYGFTPADR